MKKLFTSVLLLSVAALMPVTAAEPVKKAKNEKSHIISEEASDLLADNARFFPSVVPAAGMELLSDNDRLSPMISDMIDFAKEHIGTRYRRGGKTPSGFDCSGFTGYVFNQFGYNLGASSRDQYTQGEPIEKGAVMPGDLLFFNGRSIGSRVGHVGIAIDYDPETDVVTFIHSAIGGGIRIDKTSSPYYSRRYIGARRIINGSDE